jgi:hypothetical protein
MGNSFVRRGVRVQRYGGMSESPIPNWHAPGCEGDSAKGCAPFMERLWKAAGGTGTRDWSSRNC